MREQGKGIPRMFGEMTTQFLPAPVVEVGSKTFKVTLKNTPNITAATAEWLGTVTREGLGENQVHALVLALQHGAVTNADLRDATGLDTLAASRVLGGLRDRGLLEMRHQGSLTSYVLTPDARAAHATTQPPTEGPKATGLGQGVLFPDVPDAGGLGPDAGELGPDAGGLPGKTGNLACRHPQTGGFGPQTGGSVPPGTLQTGGFEPQTGGLGDAVLDPALAARVAAVKGKRPSQDVLRALIADLCRAQPLRAGQLAALLGRKKPRDLVDQHLSPMVEAGVLQRTHPATPSHPQQAFWTRKKQGE